MCCSSVRPSRWRSLLPLMRARLHPGWCGQLAGGWPPRGAKMLIFGKNPKTVETPVFGTPPPGAPSTPGGTPRGSRPLNGYTSDKSLWRSPQPVRAPRGAPRGGGFWGGPRKRGFGKERESPFLNPFQTPGVALG